MELFHFLNSKKPFVIPANLIYPILFISHHFSWGARLHFVEYNTQKISLDFLAGRQCLPTSLMWRRRKYSLPTGSLPELSCWDIYIYFFLGREVTKKLSSSKAISLRRMNSNFISTSDVHVLSMPQVTFWKECNVL